MGLGGFNDRGGFNDPGGNDISSGKAFVNDSSLSDSGSWSADRVSSGDPTSRGYGGTIPGHLDRFGADNLSSLSNEQFSALKNAIVSSGNATQSKDWGSLMAESKKRGVSTGQMAKESFDFYSNKFGNSGKAVTAALNFIVPGASAVVFSGMALNSILAAMGVTGNGKSADLLQMGDVNDGGLYTITENGIFPATQGQIASNRVINDMGDLDGQNFRAMIEKYNTTALEQAIKAISDVDTDIQYNHTLAELSGIGLDDQEKEYYATQKNLAINRALDEIEDVYIPEGESIVAQQVYNLGENALGGTIGREFINRWQERYGKAKTTALNEIESTFLAAEQSAIDRNKQNQINIWDKQFDADVKEAELGLEKAKSNALIQYDWDSKNLDRYVTMRGQDVSAEQAELDRVIKDKLGEQEYSAWKDSNKWNALGSIGKGIISSWF